MKISFVLPVYKAEKWLEKCISSILVQRGAAFEIILVDDGSPDGSGALCDALARKHGCIQVIHQRNMGSGPARNTGMDAASGDYICFVDPDDSIAENLLERTLSAALSSEADIVMYGHHILYEADDGHIQRTTTELPVLAGTLTYKEFAEQFRAVWKSNPATVWGKLFRTDYLRGTGVRFTAQSVGQDAVFMLDLYRAGFSRMHFLQEPYYEHVLRRGSAVDRYHENRWQSEWNIARRLDALLDALGKSGPEEKMLAAERYVRMLTLEASNIASPACEMNFRQKRTHLRMLASKPEAAWAVKAMQPAFYGNANQKVQLFLLKSHLYGCEILVKSLLQRRRWK